MKDKTYAQFKHLNSIIKSCTAAAKKTPDSLAAYYLEVISEQFSKADANFTAAKNDLSDMVRKVAEGNLAREELLTMDCDSARSAYLCQKINEAQASEGKLIESFLFIPVIATLARTGFRSSKLDDMIQDGNLAICTAAHQIKAPDTNVAALFSQCVEDALPAAAHHKADVLEDNQIRVEQRLSAFALA